MVSLKKRHELSQEIFTFMEATAPAMGLIGTLIGLVQMLQNMSDPASIGPAMAVALLTTFYGAVMAFALIGPIGKKLATRTNEEDVLMTIALNGIMAMVAGENPRNIQDNLLSYLAPSMRPVAED
jgi:chemotaxis protein MotA